MTRQEQYLRVSVWLAERIRTKTEPSYLSGDFSYWKLPEYLIRDEENWTYSWDTLVLDERDGNWWLISCPQLNDVVDPDFLFV